MQFYTLHKQRRVDAQQNAHIGLNWDWRWTWSKSQRASLPSAALAKLCSEKHLLFTSNSTLPVRPEVAGPTPPFRGEKLLMCSLGDLTMSRARTVKGWTVLNKSSLMVSDAADAEHRVHPSPQWCCSSAGLIILTGHALILPTSAQISHFSLQKSICSEFHKKILWMSN